MTRKKTKPKPPAEFRPTPQQLADQIVGYLDGGVNPLECWPLLEQLDRELTKLFGPPGRFPNCHPRLQARIIDEGFPVLFVLDFSAPDIDHAHGFRGTREELIGEELEQLRRELLVAVRGWRAKLDQHKLPDNQAAADYERRQRGLELWNADESTKWKHVAVALGELPSEAEAVRKEINRHAEHTKQEIRKKSPGKKGLENRTTILSRFVQIG